MNPLNHLLVPFVILNYLFPGHYTEALLFAFFFGPCIDADLAFSLWRGKPLNHLRTWFQEPFGVLFVGVPAGLLLSMIKPEYFLFTIIPYASHIMMDYITHHTVSPLAPFSKKKYKVGFIKPWTNDRGYKGISELWVTAICIILITSS